MQQDYEECLKLIESVLEESGGQCEYAIHVKALIERHRGEQCVDCARGSSTASYIPTFQRCRSEMDWLERAQGSPSRRGARIASARVRRRTAAFVCHPFTLHRCTPNPKTQSTPSGRLEESLKLFQQAAALGARGGGASAAGGSGNNGVANLKQIGRALALLGRARQAADVLDEALQLAPGDWELWHAKGAACAQLAGLDDAGGGACGAAAESAEAAAAADAAAACFRRALEIQPTDATHAALARLLEARGDWDGAAAAYGAALRRSPDSADLLTSLGLLLLRAGDAPRAFDHLGTALLHEPRAPRAAFAAAAALQDHGDADGALVKYRVAAALAPDCPALWANVGAALYAKQRYLAASACLRRARALAPLDWAAAHNLGLALLAAGQAAGAFASLSAAVNLNPTFAPRCGGRLVGLLGPGHALP